MDRCHPFGFLGSSRLWNMGHDQTVEAQRGLPPAALRAASCGVIQGDELAKQLKNST
jgi:hypothetical protein